MLFPEFSAPLAMDWKQSLEMFLGDIVWGSGGGMDALFTSSSMYMSQRMRDIYAVGTTSTQTFDSVSMDPTQQAGMLTHPAIMSLFADPVQRGIFVRERLMCEILPAPPNNIQIVPPDPDPNATTRAATASPA